MSNPSDPTDPSDPTYREYEGPVGDDVKERAKQAGAKISTRRDEQGRQVYWLEPRGGEGRLYVQYDELVAAVDELVDAQETGGSGQSVV